MKNFTKILVFGMIAFFANTLVSCSLLRRQPERIFETQTVYVETIKDTTIIVPADSSSMYALLECDSLNQVIIKELSELQGERSKMDVNVAKHGKALIITANCVCDSAEIYVQWKDRYFSAEEKTTEVVKDTEKKECKRFAAFMWGFGSATALLLFIILLYNIFKYKIESWINQILK